MVFSTLNDQWWWSSSESVESREILKDPSTILCLIPPSLSKMCGKFSFLKPKLIFFPLNHLLPML